jgi:tetratricopeptide (TPR) repeat protein
VDVVADADAAGDRGGIGFAFGFGFGFGFGLGFGFGFGFGIRFGSRSLKIWPGAGEPDTAAGTMTIARRSRPHPWISTLSAASLALAAGAFGVGCFGTQANLPPGQDPEKVSRAEYDVAQDEWQHGRLRPAMQHAMRASEIDEGHADAHHFVAILYLALCQIENDCRLGDAETYARKAVKADPENRPARHTLGVILVQQKKWDEAIQVLRPLAEDITYRTPELAWYDLGGAYLGRGDYDRAIDSLTKALALKPGFCWANYRLGLVYEKKGDLGRAIDELSKAVEPAAPACRNLQDAYEARGRLQRRLGKEDEARRDFETCAKLGVTTSAGKTCEAASRTRG